MENDSLLGRTERVRARVKGYFNPNAFDPLDFRKMMEMALVGLVFGEVAVYIMLKESTRVGELPTYITDILIISISSMEFFLAPFIGWLGTQRRRSILVMWVGIALIAMLPLFGAPKPDVEIDIPYCSNSARFLPESVTGRAAVRLAILILAAISFALARVAVIAHTLAYLDEFNPSVNLHMNVAMVLVVRVLLLHIGTTILRGIMASLPWVQFLMLIAKFIYTMVKLHKFPVVPPTMDMRLGSDRTLFRSVGRVLRSGVAVLQMTAMSLLAAAVWGFASQESTFSLMKFHVVPGTGLIWEMITPFRSVFIMLGVILAGYLYTEPVMTVFKQKCAVRNTARMAVYCVILFVLMTAAVACSKGPVAGLDDVYNQPSCGRSCGCDRPWTEFAPVCVTEQMTTYFSPCHAGCASFDTVGDVGVFTNCTCAGGGRVTVGACGDGSCYIAYVVHTLLFTATILASMLAFAWQGAVLLENVDRRDKSVAVGLASGVVSLVAFAGGHAFFAWISSSTCAQFRGQRCLIQNSRFIPWVGYSSAALAGASFVVSVVVFIILFRRKKAERNALKDTDNIELSS